MICILFSADSFSFFILINWNKIEFRKISDRCSICKFRIFSITLENKECKIFLRKSPLKVSSDFNTHLFLINPKWHILVSI